MKVKELIEILEKADQDMEIIMSKDGEGNDFSPLADIELNSIYIEESTWSGTVYSGTWSADDADMEPEEWNTLKTRPRCAVMWPTN